MTTDPLQLARVALDRGEYGQVLRLLEPLEGLDVEPSFLQFVRLRAELGSATS